MKRLIFCCLVAATAISSHAADGYQELKTDSTPVDDTVVTTTAQAPDFTLNDLDGRPLSLKSLRGKYVVLDFWGSWCGWCIKGIPAMKEYYEKYKGKFEILGIDCNDPEDKWKAAVEKYQLPWLHLLRCPARRKSPNCSITRRPIRMMWLRCRSLLRQMP